MHPESSKDESLVRLTTAPNEPIARMWAEALENEGIPCLVKVTGGPGIAGVWAGPVVEHELWVRESQAAEAEALLGEYTEIVESLEEEDPDAEE